DRSVARREREGERVRGRGELRVRRQFDGLLRNRHLFRGGLRPWPGRRWRGRVLQRDAGGWEAHVRLTVEYRRHGVVPDGRGAAAAIGADVLVVLGIEHHHARGELRRVADEGHRETVLTGARLAGDGVPGD